jgi:hypothetical protein
MTDDYIKMARADCECVVADLVEQIKERNARIAELKAALKPFADAYWQDDVSDYVPIGGKLTVDDFRAACVTMEGIDD